MTRNVLLLWDIDRTLIKTGGVGGEVFATAFEQTTGIPLREMVSPSGLTEPVIFRRTLALHGITPTDDLFRIFAENQAAEYLRRSSDMRSRGAVLPGALDALTSVANRPGVVSTVLTGNPRASALVKLQIFEMAELIDAESGAFGDDDADRAALVRIAWRRAGRATGGTFDATNTVVIGDTPNDVSAGRQNGVYVVAVASGDFSAESLREAQADEVLGDLHAFDASTLLRRMAG